MPKNSSSARPRPKGLRARGPRVRGPSERVRGSRARPGSQGARAGGKRVGELEPRDRGPGELGVKVQMSKGQWPNELGPRPRSGAPN